MIEFRLPNSDQRLVISDAVFRHFEKYRQREANAMEAGGQLFARIESSTILVTEATGPRQKDFRSRFGFRSNRRLERKEIALMFRRGLHYIGDWHTHPEDHPVPSNEDVASMVESFRQSRHQLAGFVMLIVGTSGDAGGLYIGICNKFGVFRLG
ncbi:MAG TPA: hypothetical protein DCW74_12780 [Alteromonas australica]|uniref:JAB domain-containing protein n=1 Tax=Alteromonas australica TaxID=589873 RepID=A0A350P5M8_9ALTE|nr:Mov34/MPN/PAD-1 family protein [Alphaproteobacteria bacterium]MBO6629535.1 Mov34/MPN/PAD-1 family protein [Alphaproteobacteria bacterium]MDF1625790.1 Mov34/MPN/PAD-1 family protein [Parvibaculaceae bacterium]HAW76595.1 hypothetical protein [Alteromonas australica]